MSTPKKKPTKPPSGRSSRRNVLDTIRQIKDRAIDPKSIPREDRKACVMHLGAEGVSVPEVAKLLGVSERTIRLDRKANREAVALEPDPKLAGQMAGLILQEGELAVNRIRRAIRDPDTPIAVKVEAEYRCFDVYDRLIARLQSLGYLPNAAHRVQAELTVRSGDHMTLDDIASEARRIKQITQIGADAAPADPAPSTDTTTPSSSASQEDQS